MNNTGSTTNDHPVQDRRYEFDCFIGVEFEFVIPILEAGKTDANPEDTRLLLSQQELGMSSASEDSAVNHQRLVDLCHLHLKHEMSRMGLPAITDAEKRHFHLGQLNGSGWTNDMFYTEQMKLHGWTVPYGLVVDKEYLFWSLTKDSTPSIDDEEFWLKRHYRFTEPAGYYKLGIEVTTPVLRASTAEAGITAGLRAIRNSLRALATRTSGMHVHLSEPCGSVRLLTAKKMFTLILLIEGMLFKLTAPWRVESRHCCSLAKQMGLASAYDGPPREVPDNMFDHVDFTTGGGLVDLSQLIHFVWSSTQESELNLGFTCVRMNQKGVNYQRHPVTTIEVRFFEGTLDPQVACAWVKVCWAVFRIASTTSPAEFKAKYAELEAMMDQKVLYSEKTDQYMPLAQLDRFLWALGIPEEVDFWLRKTDCDHHAMNNFVPAMGFPPPLN